MQKVYGANESRRVRKNSYWQQCAFSRKGACRGDVSMITLFVLEWTGQLVEEGVELSPVLVGHGKFAVLA